MNPLLQPDPGLFIWSIATFLVLLFLLAKFAWKPLLQALDSRQASIRKSLEDAEQAKRELERLQKESAQIIQEARVTAESIIEKSRSDAERVREDLKLKAREEAGSILRNAERQIEAQTRQALREIRHEVADMAILVASKVLERNVSKEDNQRLIDEALSQMQTTKQ
jgi:F-type H+-transporting ATPase subunit b